MGEHETGQNVSWLTDPDRHWIKVGTNPVYCAVAGERVVAVVYRTDEEVGTDEDGEPVIAPAGWAWLPADRPSEHFNFEVEPPKGPRSGSLDPLDDAALTVAEKRIEAHFSGDG